MKNKNRAVFISSMFILLIIFIFTACQTYREITKSDMEKFFDTHRGFPDTLSNSFKVYGFANPVATQAFGADPTALVYNDRVYLYMSNDTFLYDDNGYVHYETQTAETFSYGKGIQGIRVLSSEDLVNWTCHGAFNITGPENTNPLIDSAEWDDSQLVEISGVNRSWAPAAAWKMIDGKPKFFLYWGNGGSGVSVVTADSPTGPWTYPLGRRMLITRNTPNCDNVHFLFDPGVVIDNEGNGYLFFGGGDNISVAGGGATMADTKMARRVKLNPDMISLAEDPEQWRVPYMFEASEIANIGGKYYYMYSTHNSTEGNPFGLGNAVLAYMVSSDGPFGNYTDPKTVLNHPQRALGTRDSNNHGVMFEFKGQAYIAYHTQMLAEAMGIFRYRATHIDRMNMDSNGIIEEIPLTRKGAAQAGHLNPYIVNEAETIGVQGGIYTRPHSEAGNKTVVTSIDTGDWVLVYGVDFDSGANKFSAIVRIPERDKYTGAIELRINPEADGHTDANTNLNAVKTTRIKGGEVIGRVPVRAKPGEKGKFITVTVDLDKTVTGINDLVFVFYSSLGVKPLTIFPDNRHKDAFEFDQWQFHK
ncbi:MAG: family 43 glycosylhydrolase [Treponema sp.]|jgi:arabinoxylan arabinofuranohydrolase|nr:family 43 glycosylhydrolase [Treponema sp.]